MWQGISLLPSLCSTNRRPPSLSWSSSWSCSWSLPSSLSAIYGDESVFSRNDLPNPAPPRASSTRMNTLWWWTGQSNRTGTMNTDFNRSLACAIPPEHVTTKPGLSQSTRWQISITVFVTFKRCEISILYRLNFSYKVRLTFNFLLTMLFF